MGITREYLKSLEINEEVIEKIITEHGKAIQQEQAKYVDYDAIKANYEKQGKDLAAMQKLDPEKMQEELGRLSEQHKKDLKAMQEDHVKVLKQMAVKMQLSSAFDPDIVMSQLDLDKVQMDAKGNVIAGLEDQVKTLQESKGFLFKPEKETTAKVNLTGVTPKEGSASATELTYKDRLAEARKSGDTTLAFRIISEAAQHGEQLR